MKNIIWILTIASFIGCDLPFSDSGKDLEWIEGKVTLRVRDMHISNDESMPQPVLIVQTVKEYPCANYQIVCEPMISGNRLEFRLKGVTIGDICLTAFGPATFQYPLNLTLGTYEIRIANGDLTNKHTLVVTDSAYHLSSSDTSFSVPAGNLFWRFRPKSFSYNCSAYADMGDGWVCQGFLDTLRQSVSLREFFQPSFGEWPYYSYSRYFKYNAESDFTMIESVLKNFAKRHLMDQRSATIHLMNWRNTHLSSWILKNQT